MDKFDEDKFDELMQQYYDTFGDTFPMMCFGRDLETMQEALEKCLSAGKDVYELGLVNLDPDYVYAARCKD